MSVHVQNINVIVKIILEINWKITLEIKNTEMDITMNILENILLKNTGIAYIIISL